MYMRAPKANAPHDHETLGKKTGNTKISSVEIATKSIKERLKPIGRAMTQPEALMLLSQSPQVMTNIKFINICTLTLEERPAIEKHRTGLSTIQSQAPIHGPINTGDDIDASNVIMSHKIREEKGFPEERRFLPSSLVLATDLLLSVLSVDAITAFGLRPPELYFVKKPGLYFKWFESDEMDLCRMTLKESGRLVAQQDYCTEHLQLEYSKCQWIDARGKVIRVRAAAILNVLEFLNNNTDDSTCFNDNTSYKNKVVSHFHQLQRYLERASTSGNRMRHRSAWEKLRANFICQEKETELPVIWYTSVNPANTNRFLVHVVLSMGKYNNEAELFGGASIRQAFIHAGLLDPGSEQNSVQKVVKSYVESQLVHSPGGTRKFDRMLASAYMAIKALFTRDSIHADNTPPFLYTKLIQNNNSRQQELERVWNENIVTATVSHLQSAGATGIPSIQDMRNHHFSGKNPHLLSYMDGFIQTAHLLPISEPWSAVNIPACPGQSPDSKTEQQRCILAGEMAIQQYIDSGSTAPKCVCLVGVPGAGKTYVGLAILMNAMTRGLRVGSTSLLSERAIELGGVHFHNLLSLPVREKSTVLQAAEYAISRLFSKPNSYLHVLQRTDILLLDEMGQLSAEMLSIMDIILRRVRRSSRFMGGILIIATMDILQLMPIEGRPPIMSSHMLTSFSLFKLQHCVRSASDHLFCELQQITRLMPHEFTPNVRKRFSDLVNECCSFKESFHDPSIPAGATYVFGKKQPGRKIHDRVIQERILTKAHIAIKAKDSMITAEGEWEPASKAAQQHLTSKLKEPATLFLFVGSMYRITYNSPTKQFSQSQLAILLEMPPPATIIHFRPIRMYVCPPGNKESPEPGVSGEELISRGWKHAEIGVAPYTTTKLFAGLRGKRQQYGLKLHICSTIHGCMGHTLSSLVTRVSLVDHAYAIWERAQVVVLLSRTKVGRRTIFIGDRGDTVEALLHALSKTTQFTHYMNMLITNLTSRNTGDTAEVDFAQTIIDQRIHPFRASDIPLPDDDTGVVYLVVSMKDHSTTYIGETNNLSRRIDEHNSTSGSLQTQSELLRPWALVAYVSGFGGNKMKRKAFESQWKYQRIHHRHRLDVSGVADLAKSVITSRRQDDENEDLRFVRMDSPSDNI